MKRLANWLARVIAAPLAATYRAAAVAAGDVRAFSGWSQALSVMPGLSGVYLRRAFYQWVLARCGEGSVVSFGSVFSHPTIEIGGDAYVGCYCVIGDVTLQDDVLVGSHVSIMNGSRQHGI